MWLFDFSSSNNENLWVISAILLVIALAIFLRKWALDREATFDIEKGSSNKKNQVHNNEEDDQKIYLEVSKCVSSMSYWKSLWCCQGVIRTYSLDELRTATRDFKIRIGVGATSFVYLAELGDGRFGAVKRVMEERGGSKKMFLDEVSVLLRISHPNLVGLLGFCLEKGEQLLLLEYIPNKTLFEKMHTYEGQSTGTLTWLNRMSIALDVARALDYLHSEADPPIIHRDIKSSNVLLIDNEHAKLADFGLCKLGHIKYGPPAPTAIKGTFGYVDTNYLKTGHVSPKSDVYSFGVLLLELITGLKSTQGSETLAEWTEELRKTDNDEVLVGMLDPKLNGDTNLEQLRVLIDVANLALLENAEARPDMSRIVDRISGGMEPQAQPEFEFPV